MIKNVDQSGQTPVIKIYRPDKYSKTNVKMHFLVKKNPFGSGTQNSG